MVAFNSAKRAKGKTVVTRIIIPMMIVAILQSTLSFGTIFFGGIIERINNNAIDILNERVINRKNYLQNEMLRWSNIDEGVDLINSKITRIMAENETSELELTEDNKLSIKIIDSIAEDLIYILRKQSSTGAFIVLNGNDALNGSQTDEKVGLYLRDSNPSSVSKNNSDITVVRGSPEITRRLNFPLDIDWAPSFSLYTNAEEDAFFYKPLRAIKGTTTLSHRDLGYWSKPFTTGASETSVITYTVPLINSSGTPYGVFGIEVTVDHIKKILPYDELAEHKAGTYALSIDNSNNLLPIISSGPMMQRVMGTNDFSSLNMKAIKENDYQVIDTKNDLYGCVQHLKIYNTNTAFEGDKWALVGMLEGETLFSFANNVRLTLAIACIISLGIGLLVVLVSAKLITNPIEQLVESLRKSNPTSAIKLKKTNIREIDELANAVEQLGNSVLESSSKLTKIIQMASVTLGAFESRSDTHQVFITKPFFEIFAAEELETNNGYVSDIVFNGYIKSFDDYIESSQNDSIIIYKIPVEDKYIWVRMKHAFDHDSNFGTIEDITQEVLEKQKIERDRDYDLLTDLLNRRAFHTKLDELFKNTKKLRIGAMIMLDLDNLKHINDTFGHESGDHYLRCVANALRENTGAKSVIGRMSGDEFYVFIYGYDTEDEVKEAAVNLKDKICSTYFSLSDGDNYRIRASMGMAWYPRDAENYDTLIQYADFAMYTVKNSVKGELRYFDMEEYKKNSYLLQNKEELNKFIDGKLLDYHLQPIVDVQTGEIFAYEALMRSTLETLRSPFEILTLARSQFKLYQIEKLTWFGALSKFATSEGISENCKIFINSIPNQMLAYNDMLEIESLYKPYLNRIVIELTEEERQDESYISTKQTYARTWNASIALDDFGSGYNSDIMLLYLAPDYVKVDMTIVRDINKDKNRLKILQNLISYTKERKIKVIAEGVETYEEMKTLVENGVDYLQGYYLAMPKNEPQEIRPEIISELIELSKGNSKIYIEDIDVIEKPL